MSEEPSENDVRGLVVAITDFLRDQLQTRTDFLPEDRDCLEISIQSLEMAYDLEDSGYIQYRFARPLLDIFNQVTNPVPVRDRLAADGHKDKGNALMQQSAHQQADQEYSRAIQLDPWNAVYYCNRASARIEQQHFFEAISDCRQALLLNPDYSKAHARMGQSYALIRRPREAARCFRQALELEPDDERYRNNLQVAESQIRPDAAGLFETLLSSLFGSQGSGSQEDATEMQTMPTSFMIITESHPATRISESDEGSEGQAQGQRAEESISRIFFPSSYGIVNEADEEGFANRKSEERRDAQHMPFIEIPPFANSPEGRVGTGATSSTTSGVEDGGNCEEAPADRDTPSPKPGRPRKRRSLSRSPTSSSQRQKFTELPVSGRESTFHVSDVHRKVTDKMDETVEFVDKALRDTASNLGATVNQTSTTPHCVIDDVMKKLLMKVDEIRHCVGTCFAKASRRLQKTDSSREKPLHTLRSIEGQILSKLNDIKEFIRASTVNLKFQYQVPQDNLDELESSILTMSDQIQNKLVDTKHYVESSLKKANMLFPKTEREALAQNVEEGVEGLGTCLSGSLCSMHRDSSPPSSHSLTISTDTRRNVIPSGLYLTKPLLNAIEHVIEILDKVIELVESKIVETQECLRVTLGRIQTSLEQSPDKIDECLRIDIDLMESGMQCSIRYAIRMVDRYLAEAENHLNRALCDANYQLVFSLDDVTLEIKKLLNEADQRTTASVRNINWKLNAPELDGRDVVRPDFDGIKELEDTQLAETRNRIGEHLNVVKKYFMALLVEARQSDHHTLIDNLNENVQRKMQELWLTVKQSFENVTTYLHGPEYQQPEFIRNILLCIYENAVTKAWEVARFIDRSFGQAKDELRNAADDSGVPIADHLDVIRNNAHSEIGKISDFLGTSMENVSAAAASGKADSKGFFYSLDGILSQTSKILGDVVDYLGKSFDEIKESAVILDAGSKEYPLSSFINSFKDYLLTKVSDLGKTVADSFENGKKGLHDELTQESLVDILTTIDKNIEGNTAEVSKYVLDTMEIIKSYIEKDIGFEYSEFVDEAIDDILTVLFETSDFAHNCMQDAKSSLNVKSGKHYESLLNAFDEMSAKMKKKLAKVNEKIKKAMFKLDSEVGQFVSSLEGYLEFAFTQLSDNIECQIKGIGNMLNDNVTKATESLQKVDHGKENLKDKLEKAKREVGEETDRAVKSMEDTFEFMKKSLSSTLKKSDEAVLDALEEVKDNVLVEVKKLFEYVDEVFGTSESPLGSTSKGLKYLAPPAMPGTLEDIQDKIDKITETASKEFGKLKQAKVSNLGNTKSNLKILTSKKAREVKNEFKEVGEAVDDAIENAKKELGRADKKTKESIPVIVGRIKNSIQNKLKAAKEEVSVIHQQLKKDSGKAEGVILKSIDGMEEAVGSSLDELVGFTGKAMDDVKSALEMPESEDGNSYDNALDEVKIEIQNKVDEAENMSEAGFKKVHDCIDNIIPAVEGASGPESRRSKSTPAEQAEKGVSNATIERAESELQGKIENTFQAIESSVKTSFESAKSQLQKPELQTQDGLKETVDALSAKIDEVEKSLEGTFDAIKSGIEPTAASDEIELELNRAKKLMGEALQNTKSPLEIPETGVDQKFLSSFDDVAKALVNKMHCIEKSLRKSIRNIMKGLKPSTKETLCLAIPDIKTKITSNLQHVEHALKTSIYNTETELQKPEVKTKADLENTLDEIDKTLNTKMNGVENSVDEIFDIPELAVTSRDNLEKSWLDMLGHFKERVKSALKNTKDEVKADIDAAKLFLEGPEDETNLTKLEVLNIQNFISENVEDEIRKAVDCVNTAAESTLDCIASPLKLNAKTLSDSLGDANQKISYHLQEFENSVHPIFEEAKNSLRKPENKTQEALQRVLEGMNNALQLKIQETKMEALDMFESLEAGAKNIVGDLRDKKKVFYDKLKKQFIREIQKVEKLLKDIFHKAKDSLKIPEGVADDALVNSVRGLEPQIFSGLNATKDSMNVIAKGILHSEIKGALQANLKDISSKLENELKDLGSSIQSEVAEAKDQLQTPEFGMQECLLIFLSDIRRDSQSRFDCLLKWLLETFQFLQTNVLDSSPVDESLEKAIDTIKKSAESKVNEAKILVVESLSKAKSSLQNPKTGTGEAFLNSFDSIFMDLQTKIDGIIKSETTDFTSCLDVFKPPLSKPVSSLLSDIQSKFKSSFQDVDDCLNSCFENAKCQLQKPEIQTQDGLVMTLDEINKTLCTKLDDVEKSLEVTVDTSKLEFGPNMAKSFGDLIHQYKDKTASALCDTKEHMATQFDKAKSTLQMPKDGTIDSLFLSLDGLQNDIGETFNETKNKEMSFLDQLEQDASSLFGGSLAVGETAEKDLTDVFDSNTQGCIDMGRGPRADAGTEDEGFSSSGLFNDKGLGVSGLVGKSSSSDSGAGAKEEVANEIGFFEQLKRNASTLFEGVQEVAEKDEKYLTGILNSSAQGRRGVGLGPGADAGIEAQGSSGFGQFVDTGFGAFGSAEKFSSRDRYDEG